jgi:hypothetical protein
MHLHHIVLQITTYFSLREVTHGCLLSIIIIIIIDYYRVSFIMIDVQGIIVYCPSIISPCKMLIVTLFTTLLRRLLTLNLSFSAAEFLFLVIKLC